MRTCSSLNLTLSLISHDLDETVYMNLGIISLISTQNFDIIFLCFRESRIAMLFSQGPIFT